MRRIVKEVDNKRIFRLYRRYEEIKRELVKRYPVHFSLFPRCYSFNGPIDDIEKISPIQHLIHSNIDVATVETELCNLGIITSL